MNYPYSGTQGLVILGPHARDKPLMISGGGRSGTTAIARVCGTWIPHFWAEDSLNAEESIIMDAWQTRDAAKIQSIRKSRGSNWVGKFPISIHWAREDPRLMQAADCNWLCSLRDPVSEVYYDQLNSQGQNVAIQLENRLRKSLSIASGCNLASANGYGVAMVSYEAMLDPKKSIEIVHHLLKWTTGVDPSISKICDAVQQIVPRDYRYHRKP